MPLNSRTILVLSFALLATNASAAEIQQVSCTDGCRTSDCTSKDCDSRSGRCREPRSRRGDHCDRGGQCDSCDGNKRRCPVRSTAQDFALDWAAPCSLAGRRARRGGPLAQKFVWCCKTKAYPDSGWAPPAHVPIHRNGGSYDNNWHNGAASGYGPGAPMIYMPTDTTQLGYSYGNVPTWRPNPGMIPPVPNPSNFHNRVCPQQGATYCPASHHGYMQETMSAGCDMGYAHMARPVPAPQIASVPTARPAVVNSRPQQQPVVAKTAVPNVVKVSAAEPWQTVRPATQTVRQSATQRPSKRTAPAPKKSSGWLGLPALSEI